MRIWIFLGVIAAIIVFLAWQFPYAVDDSDERMRILYLVLLALLIGGGGVMSRDLQRGKALRDAFWWVAILLLLVGAYSFRDVLTNNRIFAELVPSRIQEGRDGTLSVAAGEGGHFHLEAVVNGARIRFLVDTGATDIVLSPDDARRAGFDASTLAFTRSYRTANGTVRGAPVILKSMEVGPMRLHDMPASVNGAGMDGSLLGMTFLNQFRKFSIEGNRLILTP